MMRNKDRIKYVTRHFAELQGWRIVPFGLYLFAGALYDATWGLPYHSTVGQGLLWLLGLAAAGAYVVLGNYYRDNFGNVQVNVDRRRQQLTIRLFVAYLVLNFVVGAVDRATAQAYHDRILVASWVLLAVILVGVWAVWGFPVGLPRRFSMWPILVLLALGVWNIPGAPSQNACYPNGLNQCVAIDFLLAIFIIAGGLYNHHLLASTLLPLPEESHGQAV